MERLNTYGIHYSSGLRIILWNGERPTAFENHYDGFSELEKPIYE